MPGAYHSTFAEEGARVIGGLPMMPLKTTAKGPAAPAPADKDDIIDECLKFFKANMMFRQFDPKTPCDKLLVYITLYIHQCITKMPHKTKGDSERLMNALAIESFLIPGDRMFPLGGHVSAPPSRGDAELLRSYMTQLRQEIGNRVVAKVYAHNQMEPDKWWMLFTKRKFLNKTL
ncbi:ARP2/3 actin-organizing complex subunit Arc21 [Pelomyxa schiedti]|nr:ARP2/3 actin-organizing complex subunit Arc21 [Pelomyxa schiedti]